MEIGEGCGVSVSGIRQPFKGIAVPFDHPFRSPKEPCQLRIALGFFLELCPEGGGLIVSAIRTASCLSRCETALLRDETAKDRGMGEVARVGC